MEMSEADKEVLRKLAAHARTFRAQSDANAQAARTNGKLGGRPKGTGKPMSPEARANIAAAQAARREREAQEKAAQKEVGAA